MTIPLPFVDRFAYDGLPQSEPDTVGSRVGAQILPRRRFVRMLTPVRATDEPLLDRVGKRRLSNVTGLTGVELRTLVPAAEFAGASVVAAPRRSDYVEPAVNLT